jgi:hypothetical protein
MLYIAHRGNLSGPRPELENTPGYIDAALLSGFDVEVDVWLDVSGTPWLGHDGPDHCVTAEWLEERADHLWCHAKNLSALTWCLQKGLHVFSHDVDPHVLTSRGVVWAYPGAVLDGCCIAVMPERASYAVEALRSAAGICSDYVASLKRQHASSAQNA